MDTTDSDDRRWRQGEGGAFAHFSQRAASVPTTDTDGHLLPSEERAEKGEGDIVFAVIEAVASVRNVDPLRSAMVVPNCRCLRPRWTALHRLIAARRLRDRLFGLVPSSLPLPSQCSFPGTVGS